MKMIVNELARMSGVPPHVVRYYARIGLLEPVRDAHNGYKLFDEHDVARIRFVRQAKSLGCTLNEIRQILREADRGRSPCPQVRQIIQRHIRANRRRIEEAIELQKRMESAIRHWETMPDGMPDGHTVCHLIESFSGDIEHQDTRTDA
jgi:DNA-binding transcriptional MerR regulator